MSRVCEVSSDEEGEVFLTYHEVRRFNRTLTTSDMLELSPVRKRSDKRRRLFYRKSDVVAFVEERDKRKAQAPDLRKAEHKAQRRANEKFIQKFQERADEMDGFTVKMGSVKLPLEMLQAIVRFIVDSYEPDGIRGVAITLKDLVNIAKTCPDFFAAVNEGFYYFATKLPVIPVEGDWDAFFGDLDAQRFKVSQLKALLKCLEMKVSGARPGKPI